MRRLAVAIAAALVLALPARAAFMPPPVPQGAYTAYTPTVTCGSGTLTTVSATGGYQVTGKRIDWQVSVKITTNGSCASNLYVSLPVGLPVSTVRTFVLAGREDQSTGKMLQGVFVSSSSSVKVLGYDNGYPGGDSTTLHLSGAYETQ